MPYATDDDAREYYAGEDADDLAVEVAMGVSARIVAQLAPPPADEGDDYGSAARLAELLVGRWLWATQGGTLAAKSLSGVSSKTFAKHAEVKGLVSGAMGSYYGGGAANVALVSRLPLI